MDNQDEKQDQDQSENQDPDQDQELDFLDEDDEDFEDAEEEDLDEVVPGIVGVSDAMAMVGSVNDSLRIKGKEANNSKNVINEIAQDDDEDFDPDFCDIPDEIELTYDITYNDVFDCLNATDKVDGTLKSSKRWVAILGILTALEIISFMQSQNGFALLFALIFGGMAIILQKKGFAVNHKIAKSFEDEKNQTLKLGNSEMQVNDQNASYTDAKVYELDNSYCLIYQKNRTLPIPKRILTRKQSVELQRKFKSLLGDRYQNYCTEK